MGNYKGKFCGLDGTRYEVRLTAENAVEYTEIELSANNPFIVRYNTSETPFDPIRTSTATINIVHNNYLEDILSARAHGTKVELYQVEYNSNNGAIEHQYIKWTGYLTPKIFDAGYEDCYEEFELEAADCLSSLQYFDYQQINDNMGIVSFKDILAQIGNAAENINRFYWTNSKKIGPTTVIPEHLYISERNFFSSDIQDPWKLSEVLEEICRYLGFTCLQWEDAFYFIDYQYLTDHSYINATICSKSSNFSAGSSVALSSRKLISKNDYRKNGATISFEPVYNKLVVKANMYTIEKFVPTPFDDAFLTNRNGDFYSSLNIDPVLTRAAYPAGAVALGIGQDYDYESDKPGERDQDFVYRCRLYDNKYWESTYSYENGSYVNPSDSTKSSADITKDYRGGTIIDLGVVQKPYRNDGQQWVVPSKMDYTRYLCINMKHNNDLTGMENVVFRLKKGYAPGICPLSDCYAVINFSMILEKYADRNYINPKWGNNAIYPRGTKAGQWHNGLGKPRFRFAIGNKSWTGSYWANSPGAEFTIDAEWDKERKLFKHDVEDYWNTELQVLNNVSWEDQLNCEGYKIPLSGVDYSQEIVFEFLNPRRSVYGNTGSPDFEDYFNEYNAYCWIKDFSIDFVRKGHEGKEENDIAYENVIDSDSVNEIADITCRITTDTADAMPSYSSVSHDLTQTDPLNPLNVLSAITENSISGVPQKPEENIVEKYVRQYSTPTEKITLTVPITIEPFQRLNGVDVNNSTKGFVQLGTELDYHNSRQTITCIHKKR